MDTITNAENFLRSNLDPLLHNPYIMAILKISLILYASSIAPKLPHFVQDTFSKTFVKIIAIMLLAYLSEIDFQLAIILAIVLVLGANLLSGRGMFESYDNVAMYHSDMKDYTNLLGKPAAIGHAKLQDSLSDNFPGCNSVTLKDLLNIFDGDHLKLQTNVEYAFTELNNTLTDKDAKNNLTKIAHAVGLPYNLELTDANAPLIATLLLNHGYKITESCQAPQQ